VITGLNQASAAMIAAVLSQAVGSYQVMDLQEHSLYAVDRNSVRWADGKPSADVISVLDRPKYLDGFGFYQITILRTEFDCKEGRGRPLNARFLTISTVQVAASNEPGSWDALADGSANALARAAVCRNEVDESLPSLPSLESVARAYMATLTEVDQPQ
jgi:hypothetical protein